MREGTLGRAAVTAALVLTLWGESSHAFLAQRPPPLASQTKLFSTREESKSQDKTSEDDEGSSSLFADVTQPFAAAAKAFWQQVAQSTTNSRPKVTMQRRSTQGQSNFLLRKESQPADALFFATEEVDPDKTNSARQAAMFFAEPELAPAEAVASTVLESSSDALDVTTKSDPEPELPSISETQERNVPESRETNLSPSPPAQVAAAVEQQQEQRNVPEPRQMQLSSASTNQETGLAPVSRKLLQRRMGLSNTPNTVGQRDEFVGSRKVPTHRIVRNTPVPAKPSAQTQQPSNTRPLREMRQFVINKETPATPLPPQQTSAGAGRDEVVGSRKVPHYRVTTVPQPEKKEEGSNNVPVFRTTRPPANKKEEEGGKDEFMGRHVPHYRITRQVEPRNVPEPRTMQLTPNTNSNSQQQASGGGTLRDEFMASRKAPQQNRIVQASSSSQPRIAAESASRQNVPETPRTTNVESTVAAESSLTPLEGATMSRAQFRRRNIPSRRTSWRNPASPFASGGRAAAAKFATLSIADAALERGRAAAAAVPPPPPQAPEVPSFKVTTPPPPAAEPTTTIDSDSETALVDSGAESDATAVGDGITDDASTLVAEEPQVVDSSSSSEVKAEIASDGESADEEDESAVTAAADESDKIIAVLQDEEASDEEATLSSEVDSELAVSGEAGTKADPAASIVHVPQEAEETTTASIEAPVVESAETVVEELSASTVTATVDAEADEAEVEEPVLTVDESMSGLAASTVHEPEETEATPAATIEAASDETEDEEPSPVAVDANIVHVLKETEETPTATKAESGESEVEEPTATIEAASDETEVDEAVLTVDESMSDHAASTVHEPKETEDTPSATVEAESDETEVEEPSPVAVDASIVHVPKEAEETPTGTKAGSDETEVEKPTATIEAESDETEVEEAVLTVDESTSDLAASTVHEPKETEDTPAATIEAESDETEVEEPSPVAVDANIVHVPKEAEETPTGTKAESDETEYEKPGATIESESDEAEVEEAVLTVGESTSDLAASTVHERKETEDTPSATVETESDETEVEELSPVAVDANIVHVPKETAETPTATKAESDETEVEEPSSVGFAATTVHEPKEAEDTPAATIKAESDEAEVEEPSVLIADESISEVAASIVHVPKETGDAATIEAESDETEAEEASVLTVDESISDLEASTVHVPKESEEPASTIEAGSGDSEIEVEAGDSNNVVADEKKAQDSPDTAETTTLSIDDESSGGTDASAIVGDKLQELTNTDDQTDSGSVAAVETDTQVATEDDMITVEGTSALSSEKDEEDCTTNGDAPSEITAKASALDLQAIALLVEPTTLAVVASELDKAVTAETSDNSQNEADEEKQMSVEHQADQISEATEVEELANSVIRVSVPGGVIEVEGVVETSAEGSSKAKETASSTEDLAITAETESTESDLAVAMAEATSSSEKPAEAAEADDAAVVETEEVVDSGRADEDSEDISAGTNLDDAKQKAEEFEASCADESATESTADVPQQSVQQTEQPPSEEAAPRAIGWSLAVREAAAELEAASKEPEETQQEVVVAEQPVKVTTDEAEDATATVVENPDTTSTETVGVESDAEESVVVAADADTSDEKVRVIGWSVAVREAVIAARREEEKAQQGDKGATPAVGWSIAVREAVMARRLEK